MYRPNARVVSLTELAENDYNLNVRRYADNAPPPEPHDVRAHLVGGVPKTEVIAQSPLFTTHGFNPAQLFVERRTGSSHDENYWAFGPEIAERSQLAALIEQDGGVQAKEAALRAAAGSWWEWEEWRLIGLAQGGNLMEAHNALMQSFAENLGDVDLLSRFQVAGVIVSWWSDVQYDLKTLIARGFDGPLDSWLASIQSALENGSRTNGSMLDYALVVRLLPEYVQSIGGLEDEIEEGEEDTLSPEELRALKKDLAALKRELRTKLLEFSDRLKEARAALSSGQAQELALAIQREALLQQLEQYIAEHRRHVLATIENWWEKYKVSLQHIEDRRQAAVEQLRNWAGSLGYACPY